MTTMLFNVLVVMGLISIAQTLPDRFPHICQYQELTCVVKKVARLLEFTFQLDEAIAAEKPEANVVFSPTSIDLALALLEAGANGKTGSEIRDIIFGCDPRLMIMYSNEFQENLYSLQRQLPLKNKNATLNIANGLFLKNCIKIKENYENDVKCYDRTEVSHLPTDSEQARQKVNKWVADKTMQKIPELFKKGVINQDTMLVLANALYMKAPWENPFSSVGNDQFYRFGNTKDPQTVAFAKDTDYYKTWEHQGYRAVVLPYLGGEMDMVLVKPPDDLDRSLFNKQSGAIKSLIENRKSKKILKMNLSIPKFEIRTSTELKPILQKLGINLIFLDKANFNRMSDTPLKVDAVVHEAFIKVDENGTEAAAATGISMIPVSSIEIPPELTVKFDRPFLFYILHKPTKAHLFMGRINFIPTAEPSAPC